MTAPLKHQVILNPPHPGIHKDPKESYKYLYELWKRTGGYTSQVSNINNLQASVVELNTLVGINTSESVQTQLNTKANTSDLGSMAFQEAASVAITGGSIEVNAGTSTEKAHVGGTLHVDIADNANSGSGETTLTSYILKANTLHVDNYYLAIEAWGTYAANANNKTVKLKLGIAVLLDTGAIAANDGTWSIAGKIVRKGNDNGKSILRIISNNASVADNSSAVNFLGNFTTDQTIECTGQGIATDDIVQRGFIIEWRPQ